MAKHSRHERDARSQQTETVKQLQASWIAAVPADVMKAHIRAVEAAHARGPLEPPPLQAPGTAPQPPRIAREPKPVREERPRRY
jgi:hypothetical protein